MRVDGQDVEEGLPGCARRPRPRTRGPRTGLPAPGDVPLTGHYVGDPQVYRPKEELKQLRETQDLITKLRERLSLSDEEFEDADREINELVEASVEFAKAGTDPKPEDALKNLYA